MKSVAPVSIITARYFRVFLLAVLGWTPGFAALAQTCFPVPSGIVGWWSGESSAADSISGTVGSLAGAETYAQAEVGLGFHGNANGDGVLITNSAPFQLQTLTIETWFARGDSITVSGGSGGTAFLVGFGPGGYSLYMDSQGYLNFATIGDFRAAITSPATITNRSFHHVAVTLGAGSVQMYIDGAAVATNSYHPAFAYAGGLGIGYRPDNADNSFKGILDEVSIYDRVLSAVEVAGIYSAGPAGKCDKSPPVVLAQPASLSVFTGHPAEFSVVVAGASPLSYQWVFNGTPIASATGSTLVLPNVQPVNAGMYEVTVTNAYGSVESTNATLTVEPLPPCLPPSAGLVAWWRGEGNATDAIGNDNGSLIGAETFGNGEVGQGFSGSGSGTGVLVTSTANLQLQTFTLEQWIRRGSSSTISFGSGGNAIIAGFGPGGYSLYLNNAGQPVFGNLGSAQIIDGPSITDTNFHHLAVTLETNTANFYIDGTNSGGGGYGVAFSFSGNFGIGIRTDNNDNSFLGFIDEVSVYNRALTADEMHILYSAGPGGKCENSSPVILTQPANQSVYEGNSAVLSVEAGGTPPLHFSWSFNGTPITSATNYTLVLSNANPAEAGNYAVTITNAYGSVESSNAAFSIKPPPPCVQPPAGLVAWWRAEGNAADAVGPDNGTLVGGESYVNGETGRGFIGNGNGSGVLVTNTTDIELQTLTLEQWIQRGNPSTVSYSPGNPALIAGFGSGGYTLYLTPQGQPVFGADGGPQVNASAAISDLNFHHLAVTAGAGTVKFYIDGVNAGAVPFTGTFTFSGGLGIGTRPDNQQLSFLGTIDEVSIYDRTLSAGEIQAIFAAGPGGKCDDIVPVILSQPKNQTIFAGGAAVFSVLASGSLPISYSWSFNGGAMPGETNDTLVLTDVQSAMAGNYAATVANGSGSVVSTNAVLVVNPKPPCVPAPGGLVAWWRAEGDPLDALGNDTGTLVGGETYANGGVGRGFSGSGNGSGVLVTNTTDIQLQNFTLEQWVQRGSSSVVSHGSGNNAIIVGFGPGGYSLYLNGNGQPVFGNLGGAQVTCTSSITDTNPHLLTVTLGAGTLNFYLDGVNVGATAFNNTGFTFSGGLGIGYRPDNADNSFLGVIDEVSIYDRALAASEIKAVFTAGPGGKCPAIAPRIVIQPANQTTYVGFEVIFSVFAVGTTPSSYQWYFNGHAVPGANAATLDIAEAQLSDAGSYSVAITNAFGDATSTNAMLVVNAPPPCDPPPSGLAGWWRGDNNTLDYSGNKLTGTLVGNETYAPGEVGPGFAGTGNGSGVLITNTTPLQLQNFTLEAWLRRGSPGSISGGSGGNGVIAAFASGGYLLYMNNAAQLVFGALGNNSPITTQANITDTNFHHVAVTVGSGNVKFYIDGGVVGSGVFGSAFTFSGGMGIGIRPDNNDNSFLGTIDELSIYDHPLSDGEILAIFNASFVGKCYSTNAPVITGEPQNQSAPGGGSATFRVTATGELPLAYQWLFNGTAIPNANNSTLVLTNLQASNAGSYYAEVTNALGTATSTNALLTVDIVTIYIDGRAQSNSPALASGAVTVSLSNYYAGGGIFYTLDGSVPTPFSPLYAGAITISDSSVISTLAYSADFQQSAYSPPFSILIVPSYSLAATSAGGGTIAASPQAAAYFSNTVVTVTATPTNGWRFLQWSGDALGTNPVTTVLMDTNRNVEAIFGTTVSTIANGGAIALDPPGPVFPYGFRLQASAIPQPGNAFAIWSLSATGNGNPLSFTVLSSNPTLSALFARPPANNYSLAVVPEGDGTISISPPGNAFPSGQLVTLTATPNAGQRFLGWSGSLTGDTNPAMISVINNAVIYANFSVNNSLSITLNDGYSNAGGVQLNLLGEIGYHYRLDTSLDFNLWTPLLDATNNSGELHYLDLSTTNYSQKFYRSIHLP